MPLIKSIFAYKDVAMNILFEHDLAAVRDALAFAWFSNEWYILHYVLFKIFTNSISTNKCLSSAFLISSNIDCVISRAGWYFSYIHNRLANFI